MSFFSNKVVAITGGSDGIGKALVEALIAQGAKVATCARNFDKLYSLQLKYSNSPLHAITGDVSNEQDCKQFIESTIKTFGRIDILINNAGISMRSLFQDTDIDTLKNIMNVNFWGAVYCTKYALPSILENKGVIVGMSSVAGYRGLPGKSGYSASKFAMQGWMEALRVELMNNDVNVMWVCPGYTTTGVQAFMSESSLDEEAPMTPEECASVTLEAIEKHKRNVIMTFTGKRTVFSSRFFPAFADKLIHKYFFKEGKLIR